MNHIYEVGSRGLTESPPKGWGRGKYRKRGSRAERRTREGHSEGCWESVCLSHHHSKFESSDSPMEQLRPNRKGIWLKLHWQNPGRPKFTHRYRHILCLGPSYSKQRLENMLVQARSLTQVTQMSPPANPYWGRGAPLR